jgi:hypothetical protein
VSLADVRLIDEARPIPVCCVAGPRAGRHAEGYRENAPTRVTGPLRYGHENIGVCRPAALIGEVIVPVDLESPGGLPERDGRRVSGACQDATATHRPPDHVLVVWVMIAVGWVREACGRWGDYQRCSVAACKNEAHRPYSTGML